MFPANVLRVMIASPGDVKDERDVVTKEIYRWNNAHASSRKLVLQPVRWETHSTPQMGAPPQDVLNEQILEDADILIGIFGTRVGTRTEKYISGTVEEIKRHVAAGKTAKVYFSDVPVPPSEVDPEQYKALQEFKEECRKGALYATYNRLDEFKDVFQQHLAIELNQPRYLWLSEPSLPSSQQERQLSPEAEKVLVAAAAYQGIISTILAAQGAIIHAGRESLGDGSAKAAATWKEVFQELAQHDLIESVGTEPGNYQLTASGYRVAELAEKEAEEKKQLEIELKIAGTATSQTLDMSSNKTIRVRQVEFLTTSNVSIAQQDFDLEEKAASLPIKHEDVVKVFNAPRNDMNYSDHSGPAIIRVTYSRSGTTGSLDLPVMLKPVFVNTGTGSTQYINLFGQKRFYL